MSTELKQRAFALFTPPFKFNAPYIQDAKFNMVADQHEGEDLRVRGWGRISYMPNAEALQDAAGELIAEALTEYWNRRTAPVSEPVAGDLPPLPRHPEMVMKWTKLEEVTIKAYGEECARAAIAADRARAQQPAQAGESIDTPRFRELLARTHTEMMDIRAIETAELIAHLEWRLAAARRAGSAAVVEPLCDSALRAEPAGQHALADQLIANLPERKLNELWAMCAYWGSVESRMVPFARAAIRAAVASLDQSEATRCHPCYRDSGTGGSDLARPADPTGEAIPAILFDGHAVYSALNEAGRARTSAENVSDVLDAAVRLIRQSTFGEAS